MDRIDMIMRQAEKAGFGPSYGKYMAAHPPAPVPKPEPELEGNDPPCRCKHCGKIFKPHDGHQVFCSETCRQERRRLRNRLNKRDYEKHPIGEAVCPVCNKTFPKLTQKQIYCGRSCAAVQRNQKRRKKV